MAFYHGQEIECISNDWHGLIDSYGVPHPVKGVIYHFAAYHPIDSDYIILAEIGYTCYDGGPVGYIASYFRPVIKYKTDISIFTAMLGPKQRERV